MGPLSANNLGTHPLQTNKKNYDVSRSVASELLSVKRMLFFKLLYIVAKVVGTDTISAVNIHQSSIDILSHRDRPKTKTQVDSISNKVTPVRSCCYCNLFVTDIMETALQNPEVTLLKLEKYAKIQRQTSTTTTRTIGSDSSDSLVINAIEHHTRAEENGSMDVYFTKDYVDKVNEVARRENQNLRLNLGLPIDPSVVARHQPIKALIQVIHRFLLLVENPLFCIWSQFIPLRLRQKLTLVAWKIYFPVHKLLIGRKTGLHNGM